jgi:uncharacterized protein
MPKVPSNFSRLERALFALGEDAILLEELDGFIAGILVCPEVIPPSEWLHVVLGPTCGETSNLGAVAPIPEALRPLMDYYNCVARNLSDRPECYAPIFPIDHRNGDFLWELWIGGFEKAVKLRPSAWRRLLDADAKTANSMSGLLTLVDVAKSNASFSDGEHDTLESNVHEYVGRCVRALGEWRKRNRDAIQMGIPNVQET